MLTIQKSLSTSIHRIVVLVRYSSSSSGGDFGWNYLIRICITQTIDYSVAENHNI
jgi:hypothetical protein